MIVRPIPRWLFQKRGERDSPLLKIPRPWERERVAGGRVRDNWEKLFPVVKVEGWVRTVVKLTVGRRQRLAIRKNLGERPHGNRGAPGYIQAMNILLLMVVLLLLFGGGGFYLGGPVVGGSGLGLILLICLVVYLAGGFRTTKS